MPERFLTFAAQLVADWYGARASRPGRLERVVEGENPTFVVEAGEDKLALAVAQLWETDVRADSEIARQLMEERLTAGNVRGPHMLWVPPRATVPGQEPEASDFVMRTQIAAAPEFHYAEEAHQQYLARSPGRHAPLAGTGVRYPTR